MIESFAPPDHALRILHVLSPARAEPLRRVAVLAREQARLGHAVGLVIGDTVAPSVQAVLDDVKPTLALGLRLLPSTAKSVVSDLAAALDVERHARRLAVDIVHGHGGRGGVHARAGGLLRRNGPIRCCTPSLGTLDAGSGLRRALVAAGEHLLASASDLMLFDTVFHANRYRRRVGLGRAMVGIVPDGLVADQRVRITPDADAADFLYVGELRAADGLDTLIDALAILQRRFGRPFALKLIGAGRDRAALEARARARGVADGLTILDPIPARHAFALGRVLIAPARVGDLPYVVLEAAAAQVPMIAFDVGGIGEVLGPYRDRLVAAGDPIALAKMMERIVDAEPTEITSESADLAAHVGARFSTEAMTRAVVAGYRDAIARRALPSSDIEQTVPAPI